MTLVVEMWKRGSEGSWSSLPVLVVWLIKDRLDLFDNLRFAAVCHDWRSASTLYTRNLYSVGDGVPWVCHEKYGKKSSIREFIGVSRKCKFLVDMPEFANSVVAFSKQGWILLLRKASAPSSWFIVNPFTRDKIELPEKEAENAECRGSFTTRDGYPHRVFVIYAESPFQMTVETACPGDQVWARHDYTGLERTFQLTCFYTHITIGNYVYCLDISSYLTVFNLADDSVKVLPPASPSGFIAEHDGKLIYVSKRRKVENQNIGSEPYRYNDASSSWKRLKLEAVMNTSWYLMSPQNCISVKERGLKLYDLCQRFERIGTGRRGFRHTHGYIIAVRNILEARTRRFRVPSDNDCLSCWVDIG